MNPCIYTSALNWNLEINHFSIITSPQNQRIESYWSILQRDRLGWGRRFFQDLVDLELLNTDDTLVLDCIHYCFLGIIREELNFVKEDWNSQIISRSHKRCPTGRPTYMYHLPQLYDKQDCLQRINKEETEEFDSVVGELPSDFTPELSDFARTVIPNNGIKIPKNPFEALNLYLFLLEKMINIHDNVSCSIFLLNAKHFPRKGDGEEGYDGMLMKLQKLTYFIINSIFLSPLKLA